jgi:hypothetical protein
MGGIPLLFVHIDTEILKMYFVPFGKEGAK